VAVQTGPHDAQDGAGKQDGAGHIAADEGGGHDGEGGRGGAGQGGEEGDEGAGEDAEHEGGEGRASRRGHGPGCRSYVASSDSPVPPAMLLVYVVCHGPFCHCREPLPCIVTPVPEACVEYGSNEEVGRLGRF